MHDLELLKEGWKLKISKKIIKCCRCHKTLVGNFYFDRDSELGFCKHCERKEMKEEQEHFNILVQDEF